MLASLGWAFLASLSRSDWIRANILLATFQREWQDYGYLVLEGTPSTFAAQLAVLPQGGRWEPLTATAMSIAFMRAIPASTWPTAEVDRRELVNTASASAAGMAGAATVFRDRLLELAPMGDELIWRVYNWAQQVAPQDAGSHVHDLVGEFIEGFDVSADALPPDVQRAGVVATPTVQNAVTVAEEIPITARVQRRGLGSYWPWAVAGVGVLTLAGVFAWRKWGRRGRR